MVARRLVSELHDRQSGIRFPPKAIRKYEDEPGEKGQTGDRHRRDLL